MSDAQTVAVSGTVTFPSAFSTAPRIIVSARGQDHGNTFVVSMRNVSTTNFVVNILPVDANSGWGQDLQGDWYAWE